MSRLLIKDPEKYLEVLDQLMIEEKRMQVETLSNFKNCSDSELTALLKVIGGLLSQIRILKGYTLRSFVKKSFDKDSENAVLISNIERGLEFPSVEIIRKYTDLLKEDS